jgi:molybdate/tungstate transport system substrate-binding protein
VGRKLRRGGLAVAACLIVTVAAACSSGGSSSTSASSSSSPGSASPAASGAHGTLIVFGAGTLATPFTAEIAAFKQANPGVTVHSQFGASGDMVKKVTQLHQPDDVLGVADYSLIPKLMFPASATWYLGFVSNAITFAYTSHSKGASGLTAANWYKVLAEPGVHIGRSNPAADPSGYQTLQMLQLANGYYHQPDLSASVLKNSPDSSVAETETSLIAALQSGQIDYLGLYTSTAQEENLKYITLPTQINLSDPAMAAEYAKVSVNAGSLGTLTAKPIIYGLTIPASAPDAALGEKFISFVLGPQGQAIMRGNGFVVISPALANPQGKVPAPIQPLTTQWPSSGG